MKSSCTSPSWSRVACATAAAVAVCFLLGMAAEFVWAHLFVAFGAFLLLAALSLRLHPRRSRVPGMPINQEQVAVS